ncbi:OmpA family protein [Rubrivirga marina]|uniref:OmpA-like domain-containing protein n=1 Tax=Rubrivirga marina TaxID=1196024 RepID=A0A271IVC4_9BACT|nr:OmpA family protein [Rubrivirga marina]PAP75211.1 hypothetical protein BSZ37_01515 [Rubrivirga marina]
MRTALALALAALTGLAPAAQTAEVDTAGARRTVTVPAPDGPGVIYFRAGTPDPNARRRVQPSSPVRQRLAPQTGAGPAARTRRSDSDAVTRLDLVLLEQSLLRALDERIADLITSQPRSSLPISPRTPAPILVLPHDRDAPGAEPTPQTPAPPLAPQPAAPTPPASDPLVAEVERAILDTGLFRSTRVNFEFGEAGLLPVSEATLDAVADVLRRYPALRVRVGGHTDSVSSAAFNLRLSQRRADAVRYYLVGSGVEAGRVEAVGFGEGQPVASNETETGRALNRRVEFVALNPEAAREETRTLREATPAETPGLRDLIRQELERLREEDGG